MVYGSWKCSAFWMGVIALGYLSLDMMSAADCDISLSLSLSLSLLGFDTNLSSSVPSGNLHSCRGDPTNHDGAVRINPPDPDYSYDTLNGIVEIFINGAWGAVCAERTSILEADVICKQLGYPSADSHVPDLYVQFYICCLEYPVAF